MMKSLTRALCFTLSLLLSLLLANCGNQSIAVFLAGMGIGGAALNVYCASGGSGCSQALTSYANLIVSQANQDAVIIESGAATVVQLQGVVANLQATLIAGQQLPGLTAKQQQQVTAITTATNEVLILLTPLITKSGNPPPPASPTQAASVADTSQANVQVTWALTPSDRAAITKMRAKTAAVK